MKINFSIELSADELTDIDFLKVFDSFKNQLIGSIDKINSSITPVQPDSIDPKNIHITNSESDFTNVLKMLTNNIDLIKLSKTYGGTTNEVKRVISFPRKLTLFKLLNSINCQLAIIDTNNEIVFHTNDMEKMEKYITSLSKLHNIKKVAAQHNIKYESLIAYYRKPSLKSMLLIAKLHDLKLAILS